MAHGRTRKAFAMATMSAAAVLFGIVLYSASLQRQQRVMPKPEEVPGGNGSNSSRWVQTIEGWPQALPYPAYSWTGRRSSGRRYFIPHHRYPEAKCLDGTPPVIYIRLGSGKKWLIFLEGWGFCYSLEDCLDRSRTSHGSTEGEPHYMNMREFGPYFSPEESANPLFHDFTWVFVRYCDGGYFSGDRMEPVAVNGTGLHGVNHTRHVHHIWFRGRYIREAVVDYLRTDHGLNHATDVVLAGCSSGAITTLFTINVWRDLMYWVPNVRAMADSGYFLDLGEEYSNAKRFIYEEQNSTVSMNPDCVRIFAERPWACFVAANALPYAKVPIFTWQSRFDSNQLLGGDCTLPDCANKFGEDLTESIKTVLAQHSYFIDGCFRHCSGSEPAMNAQGMTPLIAVKEWYHNLTVHVIQDGDYPCEDCCAADEYFIF